MFAFNMQQTRVEASLINAIFLSLFK